MVQLLKDTYGRVGRDLRVSLTDRCNLRCTYCMPAEGLEWKPTDQVLTTSEFIRLITVAVTQLGIRQVRFTGGEPLLHPDLAEIISATKNLRTNQGTSPTVALTTNGLSLNRHAEKLAAAGLDRVNISLDTLDPERYARLTRRNRFAAAVDGIAAALAAGLQPVKINTVVMPGENEADIVPLTRFALTHQCQLRFIEQMPLGPRDTWAKPDMIPAARILELLREDFIVTPTAQHRGSAPAKLWDVVDKSDPTCRGNVGIIDSVTHPFCAECDRTRLTSDGCIRPCLFSNEETDLRMLLRRNAPDAHIADAWQQAMLRKPAGHGIEDPVFVQPLRLMSQIGG